MYKKGVKGRTLKVKQGLDLKSFKIPVGFLKLNTNGIIGTLFFEAILNEPFLKLRNLL